MRLQRREILDVRHVLIYRGKLEEAEAYYAKMEPLLARLLAQMEEDISAKEDKIDAYLAKVKADRAKKNVCH
jgi:hypothetical protein